MTVAAAAGVFFSLELLALADAFVAPSQQLCLHRASPLKALPDGNPFLLTDGLSAATLLRQSEDLSASSGGMLASLRTFFIVCTAAVFGITAIAYLTAAFLVPKAAEQLERDAKRLRPGLWEEYEARLEEGESMVNRPDLLQELGNVIQPILLKEYEDDAATKFDQTASAADTSTISESAPQLKDQGDIIDATIQRKTTDEK